MSHDSNSADTVVIDTIANRFPDNRRFPKPLRDDKGLFGGSCNVTACQLPGQAFFFNWGTERHYCVQCADEIYEANEYMQLLDGGFIREVKQLACDVPDGKVVVPIERIRNSNEALIAQGNPFLKC